MSRAVSLLGRHSSLSPCSTSDVTNVQQPGPGDTISTLSPQSGAIAWAEFSLGANFSFSTLMVDQTAYIIPTPQNLPLDVRSRWISDVVVLKPTCEWVAPQVNTAGINFSSVANSPLLAMDFNLTSKGVGITWGFSLCGYHLALVLKSPH